MPDHSSTRTRRRRWIWITPVLAIAIGLIAGWLAWPTIEREITVARLFSHDASTRSAATTWLLESKSSGDGAEAALAPRLASDTALARSIVTRLDARRENLSDPVFLDVVNVLKSVEYWTPDFVGRELWIAHVQVLLHDPSAGAANLAMDELDELPRDPAADDDLLPIWLELLDHNDDASLRKESMLRAVRWYGAGEDVPSELLAHAIDDASPRFRRVAWIVIGILNPIAGFQADWRDEPDDRVAEAILWATIRTNPDRPGPVIDAITRTPWRTTSLPWILSRSPSETARARLLGLRADGNPAASIPLAEQGWLQPHDPLRATVSAWLGRGDSGESIDDPALRRWWYWRKNKTVSLEQFRQLFGSPQAADGSVWSSVLLAERVLSPDDAAALAESWIESWDGGSRRAGLLLAGLTGTHANLIERFQSAGDDAAIRQSARLAHMMLRNQAGTAGESSLETDYAFAQRLFESTDNDASHMDVLLAWLAGGDSTARRLLLNRTTTINGAAAVSPTEALLRRAWLIERFLPDAYEIVAPLHPWNDDVAALQFDILRVVDQIMYR